MITDLPLMVQTAYAELLDRARADAFDEAFPDDGAFIAKTIRGRRYWYFQAAAANGRTQKYVGPETPELLDRIAGHQAARTQQRDRRSLVATLVRAGNLPRPLGAVGDVAAALADAGVFRLRGVLVGTVAYQTYPTLLGCRLPATAVQTNDVDVAQFADVSTAIGELTRPMPDVLRQVDATFRPVPTLYRKRVASYRAASGLRVDFLTPNRGPDSEEPRSLPALGTDAQPLRFLDFLIHDPEPAVLLHAAGILVSVPTPQRYALHKLIVARRRHADSPKRDKDIFQAQALLNVLADRRPDDLRDAWVEAFGRGKTWQRLLGEGLGLLHPLTRDRVLQTVGAARQVVPELILDFVPGRAGYNDDLDEVRFFATSGRQSVACRVTRNVLEILASEQPLDRDGCLKVFHRNRDRIEQMLRTQYMIQPVDATGEIRLSNPTTPVPAPPPPSRSRAVARR
jgi:hypothetical protein